MTDYDAMPAILAQTLTRRGYVELTAVQKAVLAEGLLGRDILVSAQTGSGKTVAFGLAMALTLLPDGKKFTRNKAPLGLVIAPTRELALQVKDELSWLFFDADAVVASCVGGMDMRAERRILERGAHIVVGTPGRLRDHIERGSFECSALSVVTLDEADEMLDMGFREELEFILDAAPKKRQTLMFSATVSRPIAVLARRYQNDALRISTRAESQQHQDIEYQAVQVAPNDRENAIINLLRFYEARNAIVFCATRATVNHLTSRLTNRGFSVVALSGELSQKERTHALQALRDGRARVCVATDVAARGIDLPNLELVIHADLPRGKESLLHRSGRTGRAGNKGVSALIVPYNWRKRCERLLKNAQIRADWTRPPTAEDIRTRDKERFLLDPALQVPVTQSEQKFVAELLATYGAEQTAAALIRLHQENLPAPEELLDNDAPTASRKGSKTGGDFDDAVWFILSVGRKNQAEPRWLIPLICRVGHLTKKEIGAIRINQEETYIELAAHVAESFSQAVGRSGKIDKTIQVKALPGLPPQIDISGNGDRGKKKNKRRRKEAFVDKIQTRSSTEKERPADKKSREKPGARPKGKKKPHKKKPASAAVRAKKTTNSAMAPLIRKTPD